MTDTNSLYFKSNNKYIKTANLKSPNFNGTPIVPTPEKISRHKCLRSIWSTTRQQKVQ